MTSFAGVGILVGLIILGLATGGVSNVTSGGAGIFTIFLIERFANLSIQEAIGTVLAASTVMVFIGAVAFYRKQEVDGQLSITLGVAGIAGAFFAARVASSLQSSLVEHSLGLFTLLVGGYGLFRFVQVRKARRISLIDGSGTGNALDEVAVSRWRGRDPTAIAMQILIGTFIGLATGLFGVGGGGLTMAVLLYAFKLRTKLMLGTSLMASFFRYAGGSVGYLTTGNIDPMVFIILSVAGAIGSLLGARIVITRTKDSLVQVIVILLLLFVSFEFLIR